MAPKRAAARPRQGKSRWYETEDEDDGLPTLLSLNPGPVLPAVPIRASWNYGAQGVAAMPARMPVSPNIDMTVMAKNIDRGKAIAEKRDPIPPERVEEEPQPQPRQPKQPRTRAGRQPAVKRPKREPTPDDQLRQGLRDSTQPSDATPSPPVPQPVSTDSSPDAEPPLQRRLSVMSNSPLYPSPLQRLGSPHHDASRDTPDRESSVDNASEISWNLERNIHEDNLQRTRPSKYRGEPHGRNITAPPRRPSGLANIVHETIEEEEEPFSEQAEEPEQIVEPGSDPVSESWTAPVRTIIPQTFGSEPPLNNPEPSSLKETLFNRWLPLIRPGSPDGETSEPPNRANWIRVTLILLISLLLAFTFQTGLAGRLYSSLPLGRTPFEFSPNMTESALFHGLQTQVSKMNMQMSSLSREMVSVRSEHAQHQRPHVVNPTGQPQRLTHKINFLAPSTGAIIDPFKTGPTAARTIPLPKKILNWVLSYLGLKEPEDPGPAPPVTALLPWEEFGDCWCSPPRDGETQISVLLGRKIVPEEVVVEHIPAGSTLDPGVAPKDIEVWAQFLIVPPRSTPEAPAEQSSRWYSPIVPWSTKNPPQQPVESSPIRKNHEIVEESSLHEILMSSLHLSNTFDQERDYSDDPLLGPNFYRVGKMQYDIHDDNHIQTFGLSTIIDIPTVRVDKVVFRVKSNWGSNHTCIYRLKLHGHI
ncbi:uncharacterized protein N7459_003215 [Penicillium hispanicum]|uniref:uncharacterized protein n=1 Tax=Penicillium hispanicum TaxID=1080232 RepID=UPI0025401C28|nr:uncharacterized protein N7459_003215 [Penicillium hispanicum]KAJ5587450.1 hypothetical protein N7459_003215 [Penicillium hispanicum]